MPITKDDLTKIIFALENMPMQAQGQSFIVDKKRVDNLLIPFINIFNDEIEKNKFIAMYSSLSNIVNNGYVHWEIVYIEKVIKLCELFVISSSISFDVSREVDLK